MAASDTLELLDPSPVLNGPQAAAAPTDARRRTTVPDDAARRRRVAAALRWLGIIAGSYAIDTALLGLFAAAGTVSAALPLAYGGVALTICAVFFVVLRSGLSLRTRDPNLALVQMGAATALQLACLAYAPHLAFVFLNILFVVFAFGALRLNVRQSLIAVLAVSAATGRRRCWCGCASPPLSRAACSRASTAAPCG